jgi:hypothetical protein
MKRSLIRHIAGFLLISLITSSNIIARVHANSPGEIASSTNSDTAIEEPTSTVIQAPIPKWLHGGCYSSWCETGWYSSPAFADLDGDGKVEVIAAAYSIFILDGESGDLIRRIDPPGGRVWPSIVVADLDRNGSLEIVTAHGDGFMNVFDHSGNLVWSRQPTPGNELRSLAVYDLEGDGDLEIIVASTRSDYQWFVYEHDGSIRHGNWPQHYPDSNENGYTAGAFNQNVASGNLDGDVFAEIIGPNDTHFIAAFRQDGSQITANPIYAFTNGDLKLWSRVGVHVDHYVDLRGYAICGVEHRPNFASSAPIIVDVNNDGQNEVVVIGNVYNCGTSPYTSLYEIPFIFRGDRTRWAAGSFNWEDLPFPDSQASPLTEDYSVIENNQPNPVVVDLDNDGYLEILFPSYDGRMHAYWMDKTQHGNWPYSVYDANEAVYRFTTEPVVVDFNNDGYAEVIFGSWVQKGSQKVGYLHILDTWGQELHKIQLPPAMNGDWNGVLAAPTIANIDSRPDLEVILNTAHSGVVVYTLPESADAKILWGTGRSNLQRSGSILSPSLERSSFHALPSIVHQGTIIQYTITLRGSGARIDSAALENQLPDDLVYVGDLTATSGTVTMNQGTITWNGAIDAAVTISYQAMIAPEIADRTVLVNTVQLYDDRGAQYVRSAIVIVGGLPVYMPGIAVTR